MKALGLKIPQRCICRRINGSVVFAPNGKKINIEFVGTSGMVLERKVFDKWLASEASRAGAEVAAKSGVYDIIKSNGYVAGVAANIMGEKKEIRSKVVVAADGAESLVMRRAGLRTAKKPGLVDSGFQYEMQTRLEYPDKIVLYFGNNITKRGYVWIFPKAKDVANIGIGMTGLGAEKTAKQYLDEFIASRGIKGSILEVNAGCIPVGGFMENMVGSGILGVGDAVSQVNPIHGGGIAESIFAGRIAGDVISNAIKHGDVSERMLSEYNKRWWEERGARLRDIEKVRELFEKMSDDELNDLANVLGGEDLVDFAKGRNYAKLAKLYIKFKAKGLKRKLAG